jgi:hypothetical protein
LENKIVKPAFFGRKSRFHAAGGMILSRESMFPNPESFFFPADRRGQDVSRPVFLK